MAAHVYLDEHNVMHIIYDTPEDICSTAYYQPADPLYENGISGQMLINLPQLDSAGQPVMIQKVLELSVLTSAKRDRANNQNLENLNVGV